MEYCFDVVCFGIIMTEGECYSSMMIIEIGTLKD